MFTENRLFLLPHMTESGTQRRKENSEKHRQEGVEEKSQEGYNTGKATEHKNEEVYIHACCQ